MGMAPLAPARGRFRQVPRGAVVAEPVGKPVSVPPAMEWGYVEQQWSDFLRHLVPEDQRVSDDSG